MPRAGRVAFADQLRGLAALLVLLAHHGSNYWLIQPAVADLTGLPPAFPAAPPGTLAWANLFPGITVTGPAGVALFFLISGYVIPFSLRGRRRGGFLLARAVRLLPTYWAGFALQVAVLLVAQHLLSGHFPRSAAEVVLNLLPGPQLLANLPSLDGIVWTLNIEVLFYLAAALVAPLILRRSPHVLWVPLGAALLGGALSVHTGWITAAPPVLVRALSGLALAAPMLVYMFIGTVLHLAEDDPRWRRAALFLVPVMLAVFAAMMRWWPHGSLFAQAWAYLVVAALFVAAFALRARIPAWRLPTWLASISYPLYVVHGVSGYALMSVAWSLGWPPLACFALAIAYSLGAAVLLHLLVEEPTRRLSARLGRGGSALWRGRDKVGEKEFSPNPSSSFVRLPRNG
ncbi:acyltransferase family protein [Muricoccus radiodurans]|uniref:acyltransferase family protein n=1 Tax=Muricoccus radiodurans TaxID=2231721 RepID=UPI003CFAE9F8